MRLYVLDTSIAGFAQQQDPTYLNHLESLPGEAPVVTTIITVGEDLSGWLPACRRAPDGQLRMKAYARLQRAQDFYQQIGCLPFDESAAAIFRPIAWNENASWDERPRHRRDYSICCRCPGYPQRRGF